MDRDVVINLPPDILRELVGAIPAEIPADVAPPVPSIIDLIVNTVDP